MECLAIRIIDCPGTVERGVAKERGVFKAGVELFGLSKVLRLIVGEDEGLQRFRRTHLSIDAEIIHENFAGRSAAFCRLDQEAFELKWKVHQRPAQLLAFVHQRVWVCDEEVEDLCTRRRESDAPLTLYLPSTVGSSTASFAAMVTCSWRFGILVRLEQTASGYEVVRYGILLQLSGRFPTAQFDETLRIESPCFFQEILTGFLCRRTVLIDQPEFAAGNRVALLCLDQRAIGPVVPTVTRSPRRGIRILEGLSKAQGLIAAPRYVGMLLSEDDCHLSACEVIRPQHKLPLLCRAARHYSQCECHDNWK